MSLPGAQYPLETQVYSANLKQINVGFVLGRNVPTSDAGLVITFLSNSLCVAAVKAVFTALIVPKAAFFLARFKYKISGNANQRTKFAIRFNRTQTGSALIFEVATVLVAPMAAVFFLDEACLRGYIHYAWVRSILLYLEI